MAWEVFYEEGEVVEASGDQAVVLLLPWSGCSECSVRELCKTGSDQRRSLKVKNARGARPGDRVKIEVTGGSLLSAAGLVYGVPLALLLAGVLLGSLHSEWAAGLLGLALPALYALGLWLAARLWLRRPLVTPRVVERVR